MGAPAVASPIPVSALRDDSVMDTRTPSPVQRPADGATSDVGSGSRADDAYKPDLSQEVAMLSTKLVNAINYQTNLDDSLQATRHELDQSRHELARVKAEKLSLDNAITQGVLVKKSEIESTMAALRAELAEEKARRETAERLKRQTDAELETLTANLFEEANNMVAEARKDTEAVEKRNSQLKGQIRDTEVLLASHQEQLQDLKLTMEKLERNDSANIIARDSSVPSTPINSAGAVFDAANTPPKSATNAATPVDPVPSQPLSYPHLLHPILRSDIIAYADFVELLNWARWARNGAAGGNPHSRTSSGNQQAYASHTNLSTLSAAASMSSPNLPGAFSFGSGSANGSPSQSGSATFAALTPPLKESKFYKRALVEDLEPTLRLDLAPGLSFLSRRTVNSALLNGTLTIEPFTPPNKFYSPIFPCSLCGESRKSEAHIRRHRFRTSENDDAARYPLCAWCLERVRSCAEYVGFMRMVRDGHWRCVTEEEDKAAWAESVRLRERMFWARMGGGVIPASQASAGWRFSQHVDGQTAERRTSGEMTGEGAAAESVAATGQDPAEGRESTDSIPGHVAQGYDSDLAEVGIGRALVNMASRAASSAVPELPPRQADIPAAPARGPSDEQGAAEERSSQRDSADADAQLRREASTMSDAPMQTPPESPFDGRDDQQRSSDSHTAGALSTAPTQSETAADVKQMEPSPQTDRVATPPPRPLSQSSLSVRSTSPSKPNPSSSPVRPSVDERRPSSVLARVRAMEGRG